MQRQAIAVLANEHVDHERISEPWIVVVVRHLPCLAMRHRVDEQHELGFRECLALLVPSLQPL
jgi:hypothetical protein